MTQADSMSHYQSRERREREMADQAFDPRIAAIHLDMANRYAKLITGPKDFGMESSR